MYTVAPITGITRTETLTDQIERLERLILVDRAERKQALAEGDEYMAEVLASSIMKRYERIEELQGKTADLVEAKPAVEVPTRAFNV